MLLLLWLAKWIRLAVRHEAVGGLLLRLAERIGRRIAAHKAIRSLRLHLLLLWETLHCGLEPKLRSSIAALLRCNEARLLRLLVWLRGLSHRLLLLLNAVEEINKIGSRSFGLSGRS